MSNRNRDDREYDEGQQAQHNRQQAYSQQQGQYMQGQYGRPRGDEADDRDVQGNFSSGGYASQAYGASPGYGPSQASMGPAHESGYGWRGQEAQGYGPQGYGSQASQSYGPQAYGAPSAGSGSQGFAPGGYGASMYQGRGGYESQPFASQGGPAGGLHEFGPQGPYRQYGSQGQHMQGREMGSPGPGAQRHLQRESFGREFGGNASQQWGGQPWRNPSEERSQLSYGQPSYGQGYGQPLSGQQHLYGQQGQQGFASGQGMRSSHRGLGPKNYTRSDERIREDINERLTDADDIDARGLTVEVSNGVATLTGTVEQRWMKHRAEDIAESCSGVRDVNNQIRVQSLQTDTGISHGSAKSGASLGSATSGFGSASTQASSATGGSTAAGSVGSPAPSASSGSSSTRPGGSAGAGH